MPSLLPSPLPNRFRSAILARQRQIGCWCSLANPTTTEILAWPASTGCCSMANTRPMTC